jgi:hypothetical protein
MIEQKIDEIEEEEPSDPHRLEYKGFTSIKKKKNMGVIRESVIIKGEYIIPYYVRFLQDVVVSKNNILGIFTVKDFMQFSGLCKRVYRLTVKHKVIKKLVRFGNLDP